MCSPLATPLPLQETFAFTVLSNPAAVERYDFDKLTTLAIFVPETTSDDMLFDLVCSAHEKGVRVVEGTGFPMDDIHDDDKISSWIADSLNRTLKYGFDGLNFDNEQISGTADIITQRINETTTAFRDAIAVPQITFDMPMHPFGRDGWNATTLAEVVDFFVPMGYDMCWGADTASANSDFPSLESGIQEYAALDVSSEKIVLGLPWYGWRFTCAEPDDAQSGQPCKIETSDNWYPDVAYQLNLDDILDIITDDVEILLDEASGTKYFAKDGFQYWFDDEETLALKYALRDTHGLRGVAMWTADSVAPTAPEFDAMWAALPTVQKVL